MRQSAFTLLTPIKAGEVNDLKHLLNDIGDHIKDNIHFHFAEFTDLHYASLFIIGEKTAKPSLVFEGNIDGSVDVFLQRLIEEAGDALNEIYGHCDGYPDAGARSGSDALKYLSSHDIGADCFYINRPGRTVADIRREQKLRDHIERVLDAHGEADLHRRAPEAIRQLLATLLPDDMKWARTPVRTPFLVKQGKKVIFLIVAPLALKLLQLLRAALGRTPSRRQAAMARLALLTVIGVAGRAAYHLRAEEANDDRKDGERVTGWETVYANWIKNEDLLGNREDRQGQNHMVSVTTIKAGWFRLTVLRLALWVINLLARLYFNDGQLGGITSIHFARWVITPDRELLFMSNYDGSWESYLNDFIDLAAVGLTAIWSNTDNEVGFPHTRWLAFRGAREASRFKAYARFSMVPTNVWYSAYPDISATNMGNNIQIRDGLFAAPDPSGTEAWLRRL